MHNIAVLVTGQFRLHDGLQNTIAQLGGTNHTMFISTWNKRGLKSASWIATQQIEVLMDWETAASYPEEMYGSGKIFERLPQFESALAKHLTAIAPLTKDYLNQFSEYIDIEDGDLWVPTDESIALVSNAERLIYKIVRGCKMMKNFEKQHHMRFSHIIRLRPDGYPEEPITPKLDDHAYFDWAGWSEGDHVVRRLGDNLILAPRDLFLTMTSDALKRCRRGLVADVPQEEIHNILGESAESTGAPIATMRQTLCDGGWPIEAFCSALKVASETNDGDDIIVGFHHHVTANRFITAGQPSIALTELEKVPASRRTTLPHLYALTEAYAALNDMERAKYYAAQAETWLQSRDWITKANMVSIIEKTRQLGEIKIAPAGG
jgi:hypothetical protein